MINREAVLVLRSRGSSAVVTALASLCLLCLSLASEAGAGSELSVQALVELCARGQAQGGVGVDAAFCDWYLLPCDCKVGQSRAPRWCLAADESDPRAYGELRDRVLRELRQLPIQSQAAEAAVARILDRLYPCPTN